MKGRSFDLLLNNNEVIIMYWYVLFVRTGTEYKVEQYLRKILNADIYAPFLPIREVFFKISGIVKNEFKPLFPGYIFIETDILGEEFIKTMNVLACDLCDIVNILRYSETEIAMRDDDKSFLLSLFNENYCVKPSKGIIKQNKIYITEGPLMGLESNIKKVDRHKRLAWIELKLMNSFHLISLPLEIIEKIQ